MSTGNDVKRTVLLITGITAAAMVLGNYIIFPYISYMSGPIAGTIFGAGAIALAAWAVICVRAVMINRGIRQSVRDATLKRLEDMRSIGVETPLDFSYIMEHYTMYPGVSLLGGFCEPKRGYDRIVHQAAVERFEKLFGRKPLEECSHDWEIISRAETAQVLDRECKDIFDVEYEEFFDRVSAKVKQYVKNGGISVEIMH